jgi:hypothetical protein
MKAFFSFLLLSAMFCSLSAQKPVDLKLNLELNKTYRAKQNITQDTKQTVQGNEQSVQTINTLVMSLKPLKIEDHNMVAEVRFDTIITKISMPQMEINSSHEGDLNSSDPGKMLECVLHRLSNSTFLVRMTDAGKVTGIMNIDQVATSVLQGLDSIQGQMAAFVKTRSEMMIGEKAVTTMIEGFTAYLPDKEIKAGDKWDSNLNISAGGMDMTMNTTYKLDNLSKNEAAISGDVIIDSSGSEPMEMNGAKITPDIRGIGKTQITVDPKTGWIIKGSIKQQLKGEMNVSAPGTSMQIPVEINSEGEIVVL